MTSGSRLDDTVGTSTISCCNRDTSWAAWCEPQLKGPAMSDCQVMSQQQSDGQSVPWLSMVGLEKNDCCCCCCCCCCFNFQDFCSQKLLQCHMPSQQHDEPSGKPARKVSHDHCSALWCCIDPASQTPVPSHSNVGESNDSLKRHPQVFVGLSKCQERLKDNRCAKCQVHKEKIMELPKLSITNPLRITQWMTQKPDSQ